MSSGFNPASPSVVPSSILGNKGLPPGLAVWTCRIESVVDWRGVCAAFSIANILRVHVACACRPSALRGLCEADGSRGLASHAWCNLAHLRAGLWLINWQRVTLDGAEAMRS